jgi:hypothetical protein
MCSASRKELIEVVKYFRDEFDQLWRCHLAAVRDSGMLLMATGMKMVNRSLAIARQSKG